MCRTRIKIIRGFIDSEGIKELEDTVNMFIADPVNKVTKVNSVEFEVYYDACLLAIINYELGE
ncbi:hypothetical protein [Ligilactobacillus agilis]|uniref:hypothetical protein n=1 Tax=Ligilactobacillus agilis TaxID=1601 RepID=UPI000B8D34FC|nr:hypothetical protein [Ligilactobacillus agilis]ASR40298.1 hypothetical protein BEN83_01670 [Ligilactobacillus agilis]